jgi:antitoxin VapB
MTVAKVFSNGRSQAIRLPKEFRVRTREVYISRTAHGFTVTERNPWEILAEGCRELSAGFLSHRKQPPIEKRRWPE